MTHSKSKYDAFFSRSMEYLPIVQAFLKYHLPPHLLQNAYLDTLARVDRTNTNDRLKQRRKDIAYQVQMKRDLTLHICIEHQSEDDITMPARFLFYNAGDLSAYLEKYKKAPLIINFLFYHGKKAPYPHHDTLQAYYDHLEWGSRELTLRIHVIDTTQLSDEELLSHGHCAPVELLLKHGRDGNFELKPAAYREVFQACIAAVGDAYILAMLTFATELSNPVVGQKVYHFIEEVLTDKNDFIMTYGQQLRQEGRQEGMQARNLDIARNMLYNLHLGVDVVKQATGLSEVEILAMKPEETEK